MDGFFSFLIGFFFVGFVVFLESGTIPWGKKRRGQGNGGWYAEASYLREGSERGVRGVRGVRVEGSEA